MMKKSKLFVMILVVLLSMAMLAGCGQEKAPADEGGSEAGMPNPVTEVASLDELTQQTGIPMGTPEDAKDIVCNVIDMGDAQIAEVNFTEGGEPYCFRAITQGVMDINELPGAFAAWTEDVDITIQGREAVYKKTQDDEWAVILWSDVVPGYDYSILAPGKLDMELIQTIAEYSFQPAQGEVEGDAEPDIMDVNYEGTYADSEDEGANQFSAALNEDGTYNVEVAIFRLCDMTGVGTIEDGALSLVLEDPNGGEMNAVFYPVEETNSFTLQVTKSDWELLPEGETFENFWFA